MIPGNNGLPSLFLSNSVLLALISYWSQGKPVASNMCSNHYDKDVEMLIFRPHPISKYFHIQPKMRNTVLKDYDCGPSIKVGLVC